MAMRRRLGEQDGDLEMQLVDQLDRTTPSALSGGGPINSTMGGGDLRLDGGLPGGGPTNVDRTMPPPRAATGEPRLNLTTNEPPPSGPAPSPGGGDASRDWRNTLQYSGGPGTLSGFNTNGYGGDQKAANSVKNTFGRIAQRYPNTPEGLRQAMNDPDFKRAFPNARLVPGGAGDKIDFGGVLSDFESGSPVGIVDVGQAFDPSSNSGQAWAWMPDGEGGPAGGGAGGVAQMPSGLPINRTMGGDPMALITEQINSLAGGQDNQIQALIEQILSGQQPQV